MGVRTGSLVAPNMHTLKHVGVNDDRALRTAMGTAGRQAEETAKEVHGVTAMTFLTAISPVLSLYWMNLASIGS